MVKWPRMLKFPVAQEKCIGWLPMTSEAILLEFNVIFVLGLVKRGKLVGSQQCVDYPL
jgi:hypothetical protein